MKKMERAPNYEQQRVISDLDNNIILFASAGTGKTFSIANRINNIIQKRRAQPSEILCVTFTVKACKEMLEDIGAYNNAFIKEITVKTIHGFCLSLLKIEAKKNNDNYIDIDVCDEVDQQDLLLRILGERGKAWVLASFLEQQKLGLSLPTLFDCDVVYSAQYRSLFWVVERENGSKTLLSSDGVIVEQASVADIIERSRFRCPICGKEHSGRQKTCNNCGFDFRRYLGAFSSPIARKAPRKLGSIISKIKQTRYEKAIYSDNEEEDYSNTIAALEDSDSLEQLFWYYDQEEREDVQDDTLLKFFKLYGGRLMSEYSAALKESNYLDYDDLIIETARCLGNNETQHYWRGKYKYIIIDEMQDTSMMEFHALSPLFEGNKVMMCGDFFQTIYEWRGSQPESVLGEYIHKYNAKTYMFHENYRATTTLARASFGYLKNTYPQLIGQYCPTNLEIHSTERGEMIEHRVFGSSTDEASFIYDYLVANMPEDPTTVCVMARSNKYISQLADAFDMLNSRRKNAALSFFTVERNQAFYKTASVKDLLAFLRILINKTDNISMERIAVGFINNVGKRTVEQIHSYNNIGVSLNAFLNSDTYEFGDCYERLIDAFWESNIVVYDTETTGLDLSKDQVIQIAAVRFNSQGKVIATFNRIVVPTVEISPGARSTIPFDVDKEIREKGIPAEIAYKEFTAFVKGAVLVGHNSCNYDAQLIGRQLKDLGLPPIDIECEFDTLSIAKQFYPKLSNYKLSTLCSHLGVINQDAHNALGDVLATGEVLFRMLQERIIPTHDQRAEILQKYARKFEPFFEFTCHIEKKLDNNDLSGLFRTIVDTCHLETIRKTSASKRAIQDIMRMVDGIEVDDATEFVKEFVANAALSGSQLDGLIKKLKQIPIISVHQSKGCEFNTVIIAGCDSFNFPSFAAVRNGQASEEERVFYVAISRAKKRLIITNYVTEGRFPRESSPYIASIPQEFVVCTDTRSK